MPVAALSILGVYVALSLVYTFAIKRLLWLDVLVLPPVHAASTLIAPSARRGRRRNGNRMSAS